MDIRPITPDELALFYVAFLRTMGFGPPKDAYLERERGSFVHERSLGVFEDGDIVGTTYSHAFRLTIPGGSRVPVAGVTAVSVSPTHRRRGIVTELMRRQLREAAERGEIAGLLLASEGRIYRRFGYGVATQAADVKIDLRDARVEHRPAVGRVRIVDGERADEVFPVVHDAVAAGRAGSIGRPRHFWESATAERDKKTVHLIHEGPDGEPDGYARYQVKADWDHALPTHKLELYDLVGLNNAAAFELWSYILTMDLIREVSAYGRPVDEPLRWVLDEPRAVRTFSVRDFYWLRPLAVERLLAERTYDVDVDLTLEVHDPLLDLGGTFRLEGGPAGGTCSRVDRPADMRMSIAELGCLVLGGVGAVELARAGRIEEVTDGAARRAELAFRTAPRPWGDTGF